MNYGYKLKELRLQNNMTQEDVSKKIGISRSTYKDYENQTTVIPVKHLLNISNLFSVSVDYLFDLNKEKPYPKINNNLDLNLAGNRLKEFRKENKLTQEGLATILNTTFSNIAFYEKGRNLISTSFLYEICKKYNISADYLLGRVDEPKYLN